MMGNKKTGTLGKLSRRVRRNHARAMKARGKREKAQVQEAFNKGFTLGADMAKLRIVNATAGMEYEPTPEVVQHSNVDIESDGSLATDPGGAEHLAVNTILSCASPESYSRGTADEVSHL